MLEFKIQNGLRHDNQPQKDVFFIILLQQLQFLLLCKKMIMYFFSGANFYCYRCKICQGTINITVERIYLLLLKRNIALVVILFKKFCGRVRTFIVWS